MFSVHQETRVGQEHFSSFINIEFYEYELFIKIRDLYLLNLAFERKTAWIVRFMNSAVSRLRTVQQQMMTIRPWITLRTQRDRQPDRQPARQSSTQAVRLLTTCLTLQTV